MHLGVGGSVVHDDLGLEVEGRGGTQPGHGAADLEAGVRPVQRLALLAREQVCQRLGVCLDGVGRLVHQGAACRVAQRVPFRLRRMGGGDGSLKVRNLVFRSAAHQLAGGRVEDFAAPAGWLDGGKQFVRGGVGGDGVGFGAHGSFPFLVSWIAGSLAWLKCRCEGL